MTKGSFSSKTSAIYHRLFAPVECVRVHVPSDASKPTLGMTLDGPESLTARLTPKQARHLSAMLLKAADAMDGRP